VTRPIAILPALGFEAGAGPEYVALSRRLRSAMADKAPSNDPTELFRELLTQWERSFDSLANGIMGTDEFSRSMNQVQNLQLGMQKAFTELMSRNLAAMNLPSREDILRVGQAVHEVDMRLARMEQRLEEIAGTSGASRSSAPRKGPPRTRRPPSAQK
jgi:hypothetical protein